MTEIVWFVAGLFVGGVAGVCITALCVAAQRGDAHLEIDR